MTQNIARLFPSKLLRTTAAPARPYPTLFFFPGLRSEPFHNS